MNFTFPRFGPRGFLTFLSLFFSILVLFLLLSHFLPPLQGGGWAAIVVFLFLYFVGEPIYRQFTNRWEIHVLVLEIYVFSAFLIQLFFPRSPFAYLFYLIPVFSSALSFGLLGTMLTAFGIFILELFRASVPFGTTISPQLNIALMNTLPVFILALMLGFTVELKNRIQKDLLNRLSKMDVFRSLKNIFEVSGEELEFGEQFLRRVVELIEISGAFFWDPETETVTASCGLTDDQIRRSLNEPDQMGRVVEELGFSWKGDRYLLVMVGRERTGVLREAEQEMVEALGVYIHHLLDHYRLQLHSERENQYRQAVFDTVPTGIIISNSEGNMVEANSTARDLLSIRSEKDETLNIQHHFYHDEEPVKLESQRREVTFDSRSDEGAIPADLAMEKVSLPQKDDPRWIFVFSDLRPLKKLEKEAARKRRLVALGELAAGLAHEIRNPLGSLSGFVSLLEESVGEGSPPGQLIEKIRSSYNRIDSLITQFVQYAHEPDPYKKEFDPVSVAKTVLDRLEDTENVELNLDVDSGSALLINGDPNRFRIVIRNVIKNSLDAIEKEGRVSITFREGEDGIVVEVEDNGIGIEPENIDKIFDPFVSYREGGLGLGLSTVHRIMTEEFQGDVELTSTPGTGTTVTMYFSPFPSNHPENRTD